MASTGLTVRTTPSMILTLEQGLSVLRGGDTHQPPPWLSQSGRPLTSRPTRTCEAKALSRARAFEPDVRTLQGWAVFLDVYGFRAMVRESGARALASALALCHDQMECRLGWAGAEPLRLKFQDSLLLFYDVAPCDEANCLDALQRCVGDVQQILAMFAQQGLPLRGGMAFGKAEHNGSFLFGPAPERAVEYEAMLPGPLVLLPARELLPDSNPPTGHLPVAAPRMREIRVKGGGLVIGALLRPTPMDGFLASVRESFRKYGLWGPPEVARAWRNAYDFIVEQEELDGAGG